MSNQLETKTCSRCGGSGHYSYCQMYGTTCFKCRGQKVIYTKRGRAGYDYLQALRSKRADALQPGDQIRDNGIAGFAAAGWRDVVSIRLEDTSSWKSSVNGVEIPVRQDLLHIECKDWGWGGVAPETMVRVRQTTEQAKATLEQALAYQDTLTKQGIPKKVKS